MRALFITAVGIVLASSSSAELVENGDFSKDMRNWQVDIAPQYGNPDPVFRVNDGAFEGSSLHATSGGYLSIHQAVEIKEGVRYKLSYELKADGGDYVISIQHGGKASHLGQPVTPATSWETVEFEFVGAYDTDRSWVRKWRKATKKNELVPAKGTPKNHALFELSQPEENDPPTHSLLIFSIGTLQGSFALRNVSIVEVK